jgi:hypothetical protein
MVELRGIEPLTFSLRIQRVKLGEKQPNDTE